MRLEKIENNHYILHGKIKEMSDYEDLKVILEHLRKDKPQENIQEVIFKIPNAKDINSHIIGHWLKLARKNNFRFHLYIGNTRLYELCYQLGLNNFFEIIDDRVDTYL